MSIATTGIEKRVKAFCAQIGTDPLLVQGAGGNVSWKDGATLWVKASGAWLAEAELKEIFVPVNLSLLRAAFSKRDFSVKPEVVGNSDLRPSIETLLHALMPHRVVVHLHAVEILAYLVRINAKHKIGGLVGNAVKWIFVDYFKPGSDLARAVSEQLINGPDVDVVFLGNHGVVIGGEGLEDIDATLRTLALKLQTNISQLPLESAPASSIRESEFLALGYTPCCDKDVNLLANKDGLMNRLRYEWALYPDHVVFLGSRPAILESGFGLLDLEKIASEKPPFIFATDHCVYESLGATLAQKSQLRCYYDVVVRQSAVEKLSTLGARQVSELLNWEAEKYRQKSIDKKREGA